MKKYKVGDKVWWAHCGNTLVKEPCPVCYGKKQVVLVLGNDDTVTLDCDYCGKGYEGPRGYVMEYRWVAEPELITITEVEISDSLEHGETIKYRTNYYSIKNCDIFDTREEALVRCEVIAKELAEQQSTRAEHIKANVKKTFSWNAGYHMRVVKRAQKDIEYHQAKAVLCKQRQPH